MDGKEINELLDGYLCPMCGFTMSVAPDNFNICPSCGTEFGNDDLDCTYDQLRTSWLEEGARWWSNSHPVPANWDPITQVLKVAPIQSNI